MKAPSVGALLWTLAIVAVSVAVIVRVGVLRNVVFGKAAATPAA